MPNSRASCCAGRSLGRRRGRAPPPLDLSNIDDESVLAVVDLRRQLLADAAEAAAGRGLAETLCHLAAVITAALDRAATATD